VGKSININPRSGPQDLPVIIKGNRVSIYTVTAPLKLLIKNRSKLKWIFGNKPQGRVTFTYVTHNGIYENSLREEIKIQLEI
jgi:hypothetical protein